MMYLISPHSISLRGFMKIPVSVHGWPSACYYILPTTAQYLSATLTKSGPLDFVGIKVVFYFLPHEKSLGYMFQIQSSCSSILFFFLRPHKPKIIFGKTTRVDSDQIESVNFIDFVQGEENVIIQLTQFYLATSYKMYLVSSQTKYGNFGLYTRYLICI